ncbi:UNVERIFIED_CONTAM: hypothetical protein PYX00_000372 [Menopon gallinae]
MKSSLKQFMHKVCLIPQRYVLALMGFASLANAYMLRVVLNIAITEMATSNATAWEQKKDDIPAGFYHWSESTQQLILGSFYWGYVASHIPGGFIADRFGGKYTLGLGILSTAIFTIIIPLVVSQGYIWLLICRIVAGLGEGTTFPGLNDLLARWIPMDERGFLGSLVFAGSQIGTIIGNIVSGQLLKEYKGHWDYVFYLFGALGIAWFIAWVIMCYGDPSTHPFITDQEKEYLQKAIGEKKRKTGKIPWMKMIRSSPVLALIFAQIGHDWGFYTMVTNLPKYMKDALGFNIDKIGNYTSIAFFVMWMCSLSTGWMADFMIRKNWMSVTNVRKFFTTVAHVGPSITLVLASYSGQNEPLVVTFFILTLMFMGTFYPGMKVNALDLSPNYAGSLMAVVNGIGGLTGIITPYLIGEIATDVHDKDKYIEQWRLVFWITFAVNVVTLIVYLIWGSGEVQPWNNALEQETNEEEGKEKAPREDLKLS